MFGALLDHEKGGQFSVRARADDVVTKQMYLPDTAVLVTRYLAESGVAELADFMPIDQPGVASDRRRSDPGRSVASAGRSRSTSAWRRGSTTAASPT